MRLFIILLALGLSSPVFAEDVVFKDYTQTWLGSSQPLLKAQDKFEIVKKEIAAELVDRRVKLTQVTIQPSLHLVLNAYAFIKDLIALPFTRRWDSIEIQQVIVRVQDLEGNLGFTRPGLLMVSQLLPSNTDLEWYARERRRLGFASNALINSQSGEKVETSVLPDSSFTSGDRDLKHMRIYFGR